MSRIVNQIAIFVVLLALAAPPGLAATPDDTARDARQSSSPGQRIGTVAPDFTLDALDGTVHSLHGLREQGYVLLVFWSTHCPFCQALIPDFKAIDERYRDQGLTLAAIDIGYEDRPDVQAYVEDHDIDYLVLNDDARKPSLVKAYGVIGTPTIVLVSPQGVIRFYGHHLPDLQHYLNPSAPGPAAAPGGGLLPRTH